MDVPSPRQEMEPSTSSATRYLCAAAHLLPRFADDVVENVLHERHRAIAASPGTDLVPVVQHSLMARRRRTERDLVLAPLGFGALAAVVAGRLPLAVGLLLLSWFTVLTEMTVARCDVLGRMLGRVPVSGPRVPGRSELPRLDALRRQARGNVSVYSGFSPFVGCGTELEAWSFALNVCRGQETLTGSRQQPQPIEVAELYDAIGDKLVGLGLPGLTVQDRLHVNGQDVAGVEGLLLDPYRAPASALPDASVKGYRGTTSEKIRHYLAIQIADWQGELVLSVFLRFRRVAENLFVESSQFLLAPVEDRLHAIDRYNPLPGPREAGLLLGRSVLSTPFTLLRSYGRLTSALLRPLRRALRERSDRLVIAGDAAFDYGARPTLRERHSSAHYRRYFQKLDKEMYAKLVDRTVLEVLTDFLDERGVDTSALEERRSTILNSGVMVTGGSFTAENVAAGSSARASSSAGRGTQGAGGAGVPAPRRQARS